MLLMAGQSSFGWPRTKANRIRICTSFEDGEKTTLTSEQFRAMGANI